MLKSSKITGTVQEVILPDFPDDDNTVTTVTKSRRVSFGTNFVKEFIVGSTISGQCMPEYEQAFPSSDSSTADSSQSGADSGLMEHSMFVSHEGHKIHKLAPPGSHPGEGEPPEGRPKVPKFSSTVCFSADSPTADMEFTEGCITLAKSILDKKNKEMTVIIQAKPKEPKENEKSKDEETKYFDGSQFDMSMTRCLKSKGNKREEKRFEGEKTKIFTKFENEMSITRCNRIFNEDDSESSWEECKENRMPLDAIMRHLDKDNSDLENDLFNPEKTFSNFLNVGPFDLSNDSEKLNLNESMDISTDLPNLLKSSQNPPQIPPSSIDSIIKSTEEEKILQESFEPLTKMNESTEEMSLEEMVGAAAAAAESPRETSIVVPTPIDLKTTSIVEPTAMESNTTSAVESVTTDTKITSMFEAIVTETKSTEESAMETEEENATPELSLADAKTIESPKETEINKSTEQISMEEVDRPAAVESPGETLIIESIATDGKTTEESAMETEETEETERNKENEENAIPEPSLVDEKAPEPSLVDAKVPKPSLVDEKASEPSLVDEKVSEPSLVVAKIIESFKGTKTDESTEQINLEDVVEPAESPREMLVTEPTAADRKTTKESPMEAEEAAEEEDEDDITPEPSLVDVKVIESLKEQSKEPGCVWSLESVRHPGNKTRGSLSVNCTLLESSTVLRFSLKTSDEDSLDSCSLITGSEANLKEEKQPRLPEYRLVVEFGFGQLKKYFEESRVMVETIRHVPYFLDQVNSFVVKMNAHLRQIHSILTSYPGSKLNGSVLSFRLYSFLIFFSTVVSIDLTNLFRLTESSLSFEQDFGCLDENKIREIFESCLKRENSLCEFVVRSTKYLFEMEKTTGYVSKRRHIRLLPAELKL